MCLDLFSIYIISVNILYALCISAKLSMKSYWWSLTLICHYVTHSYFLFLFYLCTDCPTVRNLSTILQSLTYCSILIHMYRGIRKKEISSCKQLYQAVFSSCLQFLLHLGLQSSNSLSLALLLFPTISNEVVSYIYNIIIFSITFITNNPSIS
jgi:hypothetical protein